MRSTAHAAALASLALAPPSALALDLRDLDGRPARLDDLRGQVVVLNFWATWCAPCREEMPVLVRLQGDLGGRGLVVVAASADEPGHERLVRRAARDFHGLSVWTGATTRDMEDLGLGAVLPATAVFDRSGRIALRVRGVVDEAALRAVVEALVRAPAGEEARPSSPEAAAAAPSSEAPPGEAATAVAEAKPETRRRSSLVPS